MVGNECSSSNVTPICRPKRLKLRETSIVDSERSKANVSAVMSIHQPKRSKPQIANVVSDERSNPNVSVVMKNNTLLVSPQDRGKGLYSCSTVPKAPDKGIRCHNGKERAEVHKAPQPRHMNDVTINETFDNASKVTCHANENSTRVTGATPVCLMIPHCQVSQLRTHLCAICHQPMAT
jgi:hypothetical protein